MKLTGASKRISAKDIGDFVAPVTSYYKVLGTFVDNNRAMNTRDVAVSANISLRLARQQIAALRENGLVKTTTCRCGNFPAYYLAKYKVEDPKRNTTRLAQPDAAKRNSEVVIDVFKKHKSGLTNWEIAEMTGVRARRVREETQRLKQRGMLTMMSCDCTHKTPFYYPTKTLTKQVDKRKICLRRNVKRKK